MTATKQCRVCGETKPLDDFYRNASSHTSRDGRRGTCKSCYCGHQSSRKRTERAKSLAVTSDARLKLALFDITREEWMDKAACDGKPTRWWFPGQGESELPLARRARQICEGCPVRSECGDYQERTNTRHGIWAGELQNERKRRRQQRQAGDAA